MKKHFVTVFLFNSIFSMLFAQNASDGLKKFIKGNISDKTQAVKESTGAEASLLSTRGISFVVTNQPVLKDDRELSALAVASILALPKEAEALKQIPDLNKSLIDIFNMFNDSTVRISVLDKLAEIYDSNDNSAVVLMNDYLSKADVTKEPGEITEKTIVCLGQIGDSNSFKIIYNGWKTDRFANWQPSAENSLIQLSTTHKSNVTKLITESNIIELSNFFDLIQKNTQISKEFKAEIAENALSVAIYNTEDFSGNMSESVKLQLNCLNTIANANWTRAAKLAVRFFTLAKEEYLKNILSEAQFVQVIQDIAKLASTDSAQALSGYLAEMNKNAEKNIIPARNVVLAVIESLGALGDKSAFDNLLYVTYLNYPEEVKSMARSSLAKLRW